MYDTVQRTTTGTDSTAASLISMPSALDMRNTVASPPAYVPPMLGRGFLLSTEEEERPESESETISPTLLAQTTEPVEASAEFWNAGNEVVLGSMSTQYISVEDLYSPKTSVLGATSTEPVDDHAPLQPEDHYLQAYPNTYSHHHLLAVEDYDHRENMILCSSSTTPAMSLVSETERPALADISSSSGDSNMYRTEVFEQKTSGPEDLREMMKQARKAKKKAQKRRKQKNQEIVFVPEVQQRLRAGEKLSAKKIRTIRKEYIKKNKMMKASWTKQPSHSSAELRGMLGKAIAHGDEKELRAMARQLGITSL